MSDTAHPKTELVFAIVLNKVDGQDATKDDINQHVDHLRAIHKSGSLVLCGPFSDHPSGMVVVRANSKEEAIQIARQDPFVKNGCRTFEVRTWVIANEQNNYLA